MATQPKTIQISLRTAILAAVALVLIGTAAGVLAEKVKVRPSDYRDKDPEAAAASHRRIAPDQLVGAPARTLTERRFCDQQFSAEQSDSGRSLP